MQVQAAKRLFNVSDYYKMAEVGILKPDARVELIHGEIIEMSPIKSFHASVVNLLNKHIILCLRNTVSVTVQNPLRIDTYSEPEPDFIVAHYKADEYMEGHPRPEEVFLLIEVSDSSLEFDQGVKKQMYAAAGIPEYWIINISERQIEVYKSPKGERYLSSQIFKDESQVQAEYIEFGIKPSALFLKK